MFEKILDREQIFKDEPMKKHTTFKIGGNADFLLLPKTIEQILGCIKICKENNIDYYIIGNGSNLLVSDKGFRGAIIKLLKNFNKIEIDKNIIKAQAGATLSAIAKKAYNNSLKGLEFASGIPGTIGGGVCMNAGAYGGELKDVIKQVTILKDNEIVVLSNNECEFEYRNSKILKENLTVLEVYIELENGKQEDILEKMKQNNKTRNEKQPVEYPSAGSTFKRPLNNFAGKLIMEAGLAGKTIGGACISKKHCGFIINNGNATCEDVLKLADFACTKVKEKFDINLEKEVRVIGEK
ncbi:UDP-N-acetylmuramate dehydrogenase [uncultured Tyzzerella sp.]|uniref:UDP-N-acetylmuramate dehydrogenase n=1 Tax=uncultured Tyzzerella sp. TaxID=2321398 RepID=UPI002942DB5A|nr:UDP-N-acetylmuramate dehydrogenase [uncultured Tyzzerella sp.]